MKISAPVRHALGDAFVYTLPMLAGFWFVGVSYGLYMHSMGFPFWYPCLMAAVIYGGSLEFVTVAMLVSPFAPVQTAAVALVVQARHLFYGLSLSEKYSGMGWKLPFLIFWLCDETFALNYTARIPGSSDRGWFYFFVSALDYLYWVTGSLLGGLLGTVLSGLDLAGLDFVMTAMFVVIFLEQLLREKRPWTALLGIGLSGAALAAFGPDRFMLPAMGAIVLALTIFRRPVERAMGGREGGLS